MVDLWEWLVSGVDQFFNEILPFILVAIIVLIVGYIVARICRSITRKVLWRVRIDQYMERAGIGQALRSVGFRGVSDIIAALVFWFIFLMFVLLALTLFPAPTVLADTVGSIIRFIPALVAAAVVLIVGIWGATWIGDRVKATAAESELPFPIEMASTAVKYIIIYIVGVMALDILGFDTTILTWTFLAAIGALFLALAISFGWGMRDVSANMSGYLQANESFSEGDKIEVMGHSGTVKEITRYALVIQDASGKEITIPHSQVAKEVVTRTGGGGGGGETAY